MSSVFVNPIVFFAITRYDGVMSRSGADLALLLLGSFRYLADAARAELAIRGFADISPAHEFAMRAIAAGADSASELGRRLSVSKQAAAKTVAALQDRGFVERTDDPADARSKRLHVTALGFEVMRQGEAIFEDLREKWAEKIGTNELARLEANLISLVGPNTVQLDSPGWIAQENSN